MTVSLFQMPWKPFGPWVVLALWAVLAAGAQPAGAQAPGGDGLGLAEVVQTTLDQSLVLRQQAAAVRRQEGGLLAAGGAFETTLAGTVTHGRERAPLTALQRTQYDGVTGTITDATSYQVRLQRLFRSGLVLRPSLTVTRSSLDLDGTLAGGALPAFTANNLARFELLATQPLLKGRGGDVVAAAERAADLGAEAARQQRRYVAEAQVLAAVLAYWQYVAATRQHAIVADSEARAVRLLDEAERLVAADRRPRADLDQLRADRADKAATLLLAAHAVREARLALGGAMGLDRDAARRLPPPADGFDALPAPALLAALDGAGLPAQALARRTDLAAQRKARAAADALATAARRDRRHRLDVSVALGYTGLDDGAELAQFFTPVATNIGGLNFSAALRYDLPVSNRQARGAFVRAEADRTAEALREADLRRRIALDVEAAWHDLTANAAALVRIEEAVGHHRQALENERARYQQGFSTLFTVMLFQDRLTFAQTNAIAAQARVAAALARLRFETGTLPLEAADAAPLLPLLLSPPPAP